MGEAKVRHQNRMAQIRRAMETNPMTQQSVAIIMAAMGIPDSDPAKLTPAQSGRFFRLVAEHQRRQAIGPIPAGQGRRAPPPGEREHRA